MPGVNVFTKDDEGQFPEYDQETKAFIFSSAVEFSEFIETRAAKEEQTLVQTLIDFCEYDDINYEDLSYMLTPNIKKKITAEMQNLGFLPKSSQLEFAE